MNIPNAELSAERKEEVLKNLIVITGPTAVGKTELSLNLASRLDIPIINADSRQIFRELPIGTAAPTAEQMACRKHYFVGILSIADYYSAALYEQQATELISHLHQNSNFALLSGGSMMYIDAVCNGIDDIPTVDEATRNSLKERLANEGLESLTKELAHLDPEYYNIVDLKNHRRVIHALEICLMTGNTYTSYRKATKKQRPFHIIKIGINLNRENLYERINLRVDKMIKTGLIEEAFSLREYRHANALNTVGYKELFEHFDGRWSLEEAIERIKGNTRRYARKQLTWLKRDESIKWFSLDDEDKILNYIANNIQQ